MQTGEGVFEVVRVSGVAVGCDGRDDGRPS